jgi:hypothetical protein
MPRMYTSKLYFCDVNCDFIILTIIFISDRLIRISQIDELHFNNMSGEPPVLDWDRVIHKNVRASDGEPAGNIVAIDEEGIHLESAGDRVHAIIPKTLVAGFNGAEVTLNKPLAELGQYRRR